MAKLFKNNPNCSDALVSKGKTSFVYFYYKNKDGKRKQVVFSKGLNEKGISIRLKNARIKEMIDTVHYLLSHEFYNGEDFVPIAESQNSPVTDLIDAYLKSKDEFVSKQTVSNYTVGLNAFKRYLKGENKNNMVISHLSSFVVEDYIKKLLTTETKKTKEVLSNNSIREYRDNLSSFVIWCKKKGFIKENPFDTTDFGTKLKSSVTKKHRSLTLEEWQSVITYFKNKKDAPSLTICLLMYYTHMRPREILRTQLKDIDLGGRYIELEPGKYKNRRERKIPIDQPLYEYLSTLGIDYQKNGNNYLVGREERKWASCGASKPYKYTLFYDRFQGCKKALGLDDSVTPYGIKHTASVHEFVHENMSKEQIRIKSGHANIAQTEVYMKGLDEIMNVPDYQERKLKFKI